MSRGEMDTIMAIAGKHHLEVVEDAAQVPKLISVSLGTIGDFGCYSFHETKNFSMGEGTSLIIVKKKKNDISNRKQR